MSPDDAQAMPVEFRGTAADLFPLALGTGILSILTLGIYRFWAKARIRRHVWSRIVIDGDGLEYTGTGLEKFLGFLVAVVVLAAYLAVVQLILFAFGIRFLMDPQTTAEEIAQGMSILFSSLALLPLMLFATYRARRYRLARTVWRGIRFGMDDGAWGYVLRALGYAALTVASLGLLWPLMTFRLEAYMTGRMHWGSARFVQGGQWTGLYSGLKTYVAGLALVIAGGLAMLDGSWGAALVTLGVLVAGLGVVVYSVRSFGYLTRHKTLTNGVGLTSAPRARRVISIYLLGVLLTGITASVASAAIFGVLGAAVAGLGNFEEMSALLAVEVIVAGIIAYVVFLSILSALSLVFISLPILGHYVSTITVISPQGLGSVRQSARDGGKDAEGFSDALDLGGAF